MGPLRPLFSLHSDVTDLQVRWGGLGDSEATGSFPLRGLVPAGATDEGEELGLTCVHRPLMCSRGE